MIEFNKKKSEYERIIKEINRKIEIYIKMEIQFKSLVEEHRTCKYTIEELKERIRMISTEVVEVRKEQDFDEYYEEEE
jgi:hypothetical protein